MVEGTKALAEWRRKQSEGGKTGAAKRWAHRWRYWSEAPGPWHLIPLKNPWRGWTASAE